MRIIKKDNIVGFSKQFEINNEGFNTYVIDEEEMPEVDTIEPQEEQIIKKEKKKGLGLKALFVAIVFSAGMLTGPVVANAVERIKNEYTIYDLKKDFDNSATGAQLGKDLLYVKDEKGNYNIYFNQDTIEKLKVYYDELNEYMLEATAGEFSLFEVKLKLAEECEKEDKQLPDDDIYKVYTTDELNELVYSRKLGGN